MNYLLVVQVFVRTPAGSTFSSNQQYAALEVAAKAAAAAQPKAPNLIAASIRTTVASAIEKGQPPKVRIRDPEQPKIDKGHDPDRG